MHKRTKNAEKWKRQKKKNIVCRKNMQAVWRYGKSAPLTSFACLPRAPFLKGMYYIPCTRIAGRAFLLSACGLRSASRSFRTPERCPRFCFVSFPPSPSPVLPLRIDARFNLGSFRVGWWCFFFSSRCDFPPHQPPLRSALVTGVEMVT